MTSDVAAYLHPDRLFPADKSIRDKARYLYEQVKDLPILSPHGHADPSWFAENKPFDNATNLFVTPDHYLTRMLYSQGIPLEDIGIPRLDGGPVETDMRKIWHMFAENYHLFLGTPTAFWLSHVFFDIFGLDRPLTKETADYYYDTIEARLQSPEFRPRSLMDKFNIEVIATTEGATDTLVHHSALKGTPWAKRVITTFRPDDVVDPDRPGFHQNLERFAEISGRDVKAWPEYLAALRERRQFFRDHGATASDHGVPTAMTADLPAAEAEALFNKIVAGDFTAADAELFRAQMLTEFAGMAIEDGMVMQLHAGPRRNYNQSLLDRFGFDVGADLPSAVNYIDGLEALLNKYGNEAALRLIVFTLDESTYSRELAPLAGHFPCMKLGPPWWFHDSVEGMIRFRQQVTETAGFYNTVGFNDDTRAFLSLPARHDVARRMDCRFLATLVSEHRLQMSDAEALIQDLSYRLAKEAYKL